jgi:hypothetical protein
MAEVCDLLAVTLRSSIVVEEGVVLMLRVEGS